MSHVSHLDWIEPFHKIKYLAPKLSGGREGFKVRSDRLLAVLGIVDMSQKSMEVWESID